ncbi:SpoIIE family protein phosphatase [Nocardioides sp. CN2-186]|uniref:SpoIIE family protein phosphatase n=1 Tax=Nocardioides tweenelious TaxID=3156607 RepID=UPI0032B5EA19
MQRQDDELQLLDALSLAVLASDAGGVVTFANNAATQMFGRSVQELLGSQVVDLVALGPGETPALPAVLQGVPWRGDLTVSRGPDDDIVAEATVNPILGPDGEVVGAIAALEDMTEIRRTEAEAAEGEIRLRLAHAAAELGTWHWNALDGTNVWDDQMHRIYGLPPGGFDGTWDAWVASIHPDDRESAIAIVQEAMGNLSSYVLRNRIVRPDGKPTWIEAHGKVLVGPDGGPAGTIGCLQDVTARILLEQQQADASARALLLQQVTADFSEARTPDQVAAVHSASLERVRGLIDTDSGAPVSEADAQLLDTLASQYEIAAARADLFLHTTTISEELQFSLAASPLPALDRFEVAAYYAPGGDDLEHVGGDWYDAIGSPTGGLVLVVGDVMGRGVRAATTMIHVRSALRGLLTVETAPDKLLTAADQMMARDAPDQFVTAAALHIEPDSGTLELSNAGHPPLVLIHADGTAEVVEGGAGLPLAVQPLEGRTSVRVPVEPGATVVLVTDGVVESKDRDIDEGIELLRQRAAELAGGSLEALVAGLADLADERLHDDVTVVAARLR